LAGSTQLKEKEKTWNHGFRQFKPNVTARISTSEHVYPHVLSKLI